MQRMAWAAVVLGVLLMLIAPLFLLLAMPPWPFWENQGWSVPLLVAAGCSAMQGFVLLLFGVFGAALVRLEYASDQAAARAARKDIARREQLGREWG